MPDNVQEEYRERVLAEFRQLHKELDKLSEKLDELKDGDITLLKIEMAVIKKENQIHAGIAGARAGLIYGALSSIVVGIIVALVAAWFNKGGH